MFDSLSTLFLVPVFVAGAVAVWLAGIQLSNMTDVLAKRLKLGEALGGLLLLAIATNLPEIAITITASVTNQVDLAVGNILGGIAIQTVVLVLLDVCGPGDKGPLTYRVKSLVPLIEALVVVAVLIMAIMGTQLPKSLVFWRITPDGILITGTWLLGLWLVSKARRDIPWQLKEQAANKNQDNKGQDDDKGQDDKQKNEPSTLKASLIFGAAAVITLIGGVVLEQSGSSLSDKIGLSGVLFGSTVLAAATALPEVSTGLASIKLGDDQLAMSDIFGGNAFLPVLFLLATLVSGKAVLPEAKNSDIYLAGLGILVTVAYMVGLSFRPKRRVGRMGLDSLAVLIIYLVGLGGLVAIAMTQ